MIIETIRVLLVEDVPVIAKVTQRMLLHVGGGRYVVSHKLNLGDALAAVAGEDFEIILLDLNLPDSQGLDTLSRVAEAAPAVPIVVMTATESEETGLRAVQLGAQDFLVKGHFTESALQRSMMYSIERHRLQRTIRQLAVMDELTSLYNRRGFNSLHGDLVQRVRQARGRGFICYFDLDCFKGINDVHGHQKGDEALAQFAAALRSTFRKDTLIVRMGGDEFVTMGMEQHEGHVGECLQALEQVLETRNTHPEAEYRIETSVGVKQFDAETTGTVDEYRVELSTQNDLAEIKVVIESPGSTNTSSAAAACARWRRIPNSRSAHEWRRPVGSRHRNGGAPAAGLRSP